MCLHGKDSVGVTVGRAHSPPCRRTYGSWESKRLSQVILKALSDFFPEDLRSEKEVVVKIELTY